MGRLQSNNSRAIREGFKGLVSAKDLAIERGMKDLLQVAMMFALTGHDNVHFGHKITRDSYGWVLLHDGKYVAHNVNEGQHGEGSAYALLMEKSKSVGPGWVGILLASMEAEIEHTRNVYFVVSYEEDILLSAQEDIKHAFHRFFKPL